MVFVFFLEGFSANSKAVVKKHSGRREKTRKHNGAKEPFQRLHQKRGESKGGARRKSSNSY